LWIRVIRFRIILLTTMLAYSGGTHIPHPQNNTALAGK